MKKSLLLLVVQFLILNGLFAQIPTNYWDSAAGKSGYELKTALFNIIKNPAVDTYTGLWSDYPKTDKRSDGKVWDIYSNTNFSYTSDQCGTYKTEGDCYNREHSFPKSWFNEATPMYSDIMHIYPVDGYTNGRRSNNPYGEVSSPTWTSSNGSKLGPNSYPGYTGTVFEPIDEYKGDLARTYFYMVTCYEDKVVAWNSPMLDGTSNHAFTTWALNMLLEWNDSDPVSQKEIDRNNAVYQIQGNANPYISHPEYVHVVWGGGASNQNSSPYFTSTPIYKLNPGQAYAYNVKVADPDSSDTLLIRAANLPSFLSFVDNGDRTALLSGTATSADTGTFDIQLVVSDGKATSNQNFTLEVSQTAQNGDYVLEEHFENFVSSSYFTGSMNLESGTWSFTQVYPESSTNSYDGSKAVRINDDKTGANITTPQISSAGSIRFMYRTLNDEANVSTFQLQISTDGGSSFNTVNNQEFQHNVYSEYSYTLNQPSALNIRILNDNQSGHLIIDDLKVTPYKETTGLKSDKSPKLVFYPNPATDFIHLNASNVQLLIVDLQGRILLSKKLQAEQDINISQLQRGIYILRLLSEQKIAEYKLIKK